LLPRRTGVICVDVPRVNEWLARLLDGIVRGAGETGHEIITSVHAYGTLPQVVLRGQVDGLIRMLSQCDYVRRIPPLPRSPVPTVSILYPAPGADVVGVDHFGSARALGLYLGGMGHSIAACVGHSEPIGRARLSGIRCGLEERGVALPPDLVRVEEALEAAVVMPLVEELLDLRAAGRPGQQFTLMAFYNDYLARHAIAVIRARGLRVPEDIGVAGYDDLDMPVARDVRLTTVHLPLEELGAEAVRRVHWRMGHPSAPPLHWLLETRVVEGDSVVARSA